MWSISRAQLTGPGRYLTHGVAEAGADPRKPVGRRFGTAVEPLGKSSARLYSPVA